MIALFCFVFELSPMSKFLLVKSVILITFISFENLIVSSMNIYQGLGVLLGARVIALYGLYYDVKK